jgi:hypothetical protein
MRGAVLVLAVIVAALFVASARAADMTSAAKKELDTAIFHANAAAGYNTTKEIELHLHHVVNCLEGKNGKNYFTPSGDVCQGMGSGIFADLKDSGMAGAHALPYAEIADQVALWGISKGMANDVGRAKAAAQMAKLVLEQAKANFK